MSNSARQRLSHSALLTNTSRTAVRSARCFDAIVVPATRPFALQRIITLSAHIPVPLVLLCSKQARVESVSQRVEETLGSRALVIEVPEDYQLRGNRQATGARAFREASGGRVSDLSVKRNLGLLIARLRGWQRILFVDDDIDLRRRDVAKVARQLDRHPVAAMRSRYFPDNSVVCHAGRLVGMPQDVFVSGAVLGVNPQHPGLPFFPDVYNEDWFFFARHAAERILPKVGEVRQDEYEPFANPLRAAQEEFGDLLAEGLYSIFDDTPGWTFRDQLSMASDHRYWRSFIDDRRSLIADIWNRLEDRAMAGRLAHRPAYGALESLRHADKQSAAISADLCVQFIESWREDSERWRRELPPEGLALSERDALDELGLVNWISCGYGSPVREPARV